MGRSQILVGLGALLLAACTDTTASEFNPFGRYTLARINGESLPAQVHQTSVATLVFTRGELRLNSDFTFTDVTDLKVTPRSSGGETRTASDTARGMFRLVGDTVFFDSTRGENYYMTFQASGSLMQRLGESLLLYRK